MVLNTLLIAATLLTGFDFGGRVGAAFPTAGGSRTLRSSTLLGAHLGFGSSRHRFQLNYAFFDFPGKQNARYEITIHEISGVYHYAPLYRENWGLALGAGPGLGLLRRRYHPGAEQGVAPNAHLGIAVYQRERHSRVSAGLDNIIFFSLPAGRSPNLTYLPALYAEVAYAF